MTENEALDSLNNLHYKIVHTSFCNKVYESEIEALCMAKDALKEIQRYRAIGTVDEFKALKEKSEPKIPNYEGDGYYAGQIVLDTWICPECGKAYEVDYEDYEYCPNCGQHIDHSSLTEDD